MGRLQTNVRDMGENWLPSVRALSQMEYFLARARGALLGEVLQSKTPTELDEGAKRLGAYFDKYEEARRNYAAQMIASPDERKLFDAVQPFVADYHAEGDKVIALMRQNNAAAAADTAIRARDKFALMIAAQDKVIDFNNQGSMAAMQAAQSTFTNAKIIVGVAISAALAIGILSYLMVVRTVCTPILTLRERMGLLAADDLSVEIPNCDRQDEIGAMARAVEVFKRNGIERREMQEREKAEIAQREERARRRDAATASFNREVAGIMQTVTAASSELEGTAASLSSTAEEGARQAAAVAAGAEEANTNVSTEPWPAMPMRKAGAPMSASRDWFNQRRRSVRWCG
jgi:methyl-accepting chemotaxis protein